MTPPVVLIAAARAGARLTPTGGGCVAFMVGPEAAGPYALIVPHFPAEDGEDGCSEPVPFDSLDQPAWVGFYPDGETAEETAARTFPSLARALATVADLLAHYAATGSLPTEAP